MKGELERGTEALHERDRAAAVGARQFDPETASTPPLEIEQGTDEERGETLQQLLPEAFATVREASRRVLGMRHADVQLAI